MLSGFSPAAWASLKSWGISLGGALLTIATEVVTRYLTENQASLGAFAAPVLWIWNAFLGQINAWLKPKTPTPAASEFQPPSLDVGGRD